jgi:hypothetical protein
MMSRLHLLPIVGVITAAAMGLHRGPLPPARCTIIVRHTEPEFTRATLVGLGTALPESLAAPGGTYAAPVFQGNGPAPRPLAWRFAIHEVPAAIVDTHRALLARSSGRVWVVPWTRDSMCRVQSGWVGERNLKFPHAVLFLTPRPESLWVNGEPTYDTFDGEFSARVIWERDSASKAPMSLEDLRTFLAVYPRLAGFEPWKDGSFLAWAHAHRDSANSRALRPRLQAMISNHMRDSLNRLPARLAGVWRGTGTLANGDSIHFWMQLCDGKRLFWWPAREWGPALTYTGDARFESTPLPTQYGLAVHYAQTRDSLTCDGGPLREELTLPLQSSIAANGSGSWALLARFGPPAWRAEFYRNDSLVRGKLSAIGSYPHLGARISMNANGDSLSAFIWRLSIPDTLAAATVARWSARRVP